ncbi:F-box/kelch-repeat protein At3g06240-like [Cornus florida]|uniref:F-box/kelch-repeat protein At3g06240-like n=1 Tax=Cornus florida TaxID=4283 RepID=UPI00289BEF8B|nr:F-box/kelch-repeat protein At3g06240-like [Cornus florida]
MVMKKAETTNHDSFEEEATRLPYLPRHLLVEILSKLPVKSLLRFKGVSKSWRSLISDSHFIKTHLNQSLRESNIQTQRILIAPSHSPFGLYTASFGSANNDILVEKIDFVVQNNPHPRCEIIGSCNGLICMEVDFEFIYVFNPSTRESKQIPDCDFPCDIGFGYDHCSDDYKLVKITSNSMCVYSLRIGSWRKVQDFPKYSVNVFGNGMQLNGAIHWLCLKNDSDYTFEITAFSLVDEKLCKIPMPTSVTDFNVASQLGVFEGCLSVLPCDDAFWVMKEYGVKQSWTKFVIKNSFSDILESLSLLNYDEALLLIVYCTKLVSYNYRKRRYESIVVSDIAEKDEDIHATITIYVNSLVSPAQMCEADK